MKIKKKKIIILIGLVLLTITITGCISGNVETRDNNLLKLPIFRLNNCVTGGRLKDYINNTLFSFSMNIENPNDVTIDIQIIYFNIIDELGNIIYTFKPTPNPELESKQFSTDKFSLKSKEIITLYNENYINNNLLNNYYWRYMFSHSYLNFSISGLYKFNNDLSWFESNSCEIVIIM
jgi:hypothetical protein